MEEKERQEKNQENRKKRLVFLMSCRFLLKKNEIERDQKSHGSILFLFLHFRVVLKNSQNHSLALP